VPGRVAGTVAVISILLDTQSAESQDRPSTMAAIPYTDHHLHQNLRYKDYQLASRVAEVQRENAPDPQQMKQTTGLFESETVRDFGSQMQQRGVYAWWRQGMGFTGSEDRL
jgi:hypothetical protein